MKFYTASAEQSAIESIFACETPKRLSLYAAAEYATFHASIKQHY